MKYPFVPKSNKFLTRGDYWLMELTNGKLAIGIVMDIPPAELKLTKQFVAGLLDWSAKEKPEIQKLKNLPILKQGKVHVKTVGFTGQEIVGNINLEELNIETQLQREQTGYQSSAVILKGYRKIRNMEREDIDKYSVLGGWGYDVIKIYAED